LEEVLADDAIVQMKRSVLKKRPAVKNGSGSLVARK
jgi:hypothetical protein